MHRTLVVISLFMIVSAAAVFFGATIVHNQEAASITRAGSCVAIPASPDYLSSGSPRDAIAAINNARAYEHLHPLRLPSNFYQVNVVQQQFVLVNLERTDRGLPVFHMDNNLSQMALAYSIQLHDLNFFAHNSPIGGTFGQRMNSNPYVEGHYSLAAENLAGNPAGSAGAMYEYMYNDVNESCGHRQNILDPTLHYIGIGAVASDQYGTISAQEFLASASWNAYKGAQTSLIAPLIKMSVNHYIPKTFILCEVNTHVYTGNARVTWFLDSLRSGGQGGPLWSLDMRHLTPGQHTIYAYVVDGMQSYAVASYIFRI